MRSFSKWLVVSSFYSMFCAFTAAHIKFVSGENIILLTNLSFHSLGTGEVPKSKEDGVSFLEYVMLVSFFTVGVGNTSTGFDMTVLLHQFCPVTYPLPL